MQIAARIGTLVGLAVGVVFREAKACMLAFSLPALGQEIPTYEVGSVPPLRVPHRTTAALTILAPDLGGVFTFSSTPAPRPTGAILLVGNHLAYEPDPGDKTPFVLTCRASSGAASVSQAVTLTPVPVLPAEAVILGDFPAPLPDDEGGNYI